MKEYGKNWYRSIFKLKDKDTLIELLIEEMEKVNTQRKIEVDAQWISKYREVSSNCYLFSADLVEENQQLIKDNLKLQEHIIQLLKERESNED